MIAQRQGAVPARACRSAASAAFAAAPILRESRIAKGGERRVKEELVKLQRMFARVHNPLPAVFDRLGLRTKPYRMTVRDGTVMELRPGTGDFFGFYEILLRGDYFAGGQRLRPGQTVIDIGANIGCFTVAAARLVGPTGRVLAIEPEETTFRQLQRNVELNRLGNVTVLRQAVAGSAGEIVLHADSNRLFSSIYAEVNGRATTQGGDQIVPVTTLAQLMDACGIARCDYLKLDCEGAEHDIVASLTPATAARIDGITMEVHKVHGQDGQTLGQRLAALGFGRVGASTLPYYSRMTPSPSH